MLGHLRGGLIQIGRWDEGDGRSIHGAADRESCQRLWRRRNAGTKERKCLAHKVSNRKGTGAFLTPSRLDQSRTLSLS